MVDRENWLMVDGTLVAGSSKLPHISDDELWNV